MTLYCVRRDFIFEVAECGTPENPHSHLRSVFLYRATISNGKCEELGEDFEFKGRKNIFGFDVFGFWNLKSESHSFFTIDSVEQYIRLKLESWNRAEAGKEAADKIAKKWAGFPGVSAAKHVADFLEKVRKAGEEHGNIYDFLMDSECDEEEESSDLEKTLDSLEEDACANAEALFDLEENVDDMATDLERAVNRIKKLEALITAASSRLDGHFGHIKMLRKEIEGLKERLSQVESTKVKKTNDKEK